MRAPVITTTRRSKERRRRRQPIREEEADSDHWSSEITTAANYPDRHGRERCDGWGDFERRGTEGRGMPAHGRDGRDWGDHGRKMEEERIRPGDRGMPGPSGQGQINKGGVHSNFHQNENSQNVSASTGPQGGNFGGQNRPNDHRFTHRY